MSDYCKFYVRRHAGSLSLGINPFYYWAISSDKHQSPNRNNNIID